ncbi:unnamed protein product [Kuraishia capsulata CBS 1993]|uniref:Chitin synthase n=1 Tax=Kuraishia capsulata CBS 1993 TaxID=1382522 RepID=W6MQJ2_9ASCO|nr:uncharacterized protein KUCA_T00004582001 [Kuraishia capsulata CBS 1993]CDK28598.1 unnamed protein product [Kuraishia capsulata CBS 1993]
MSNQTYRYSDDEDEEESIRDSRVYSPQRQPTVSAAQNAYGDEDEDEDEEDYTGTSKNFESYYAEYKDPFSVYSRPISMVPPPSSHQSSPFLQVPQEDPFGSSPRSSVSQQELPQLKYEGSLSDDDYYNTYRRNEGHSFERDPEKDHGYVIGDFVPDYDEFDNEEVHVSGFQNEQLPLNNAVKPMGTVLMEEPGSQNDQNDQGQPRNLPQKVKLVDGNFMFDCPIPPTLRDELPFEETKGLAEFTTMRYQAITCQPKDFSSCGFKVRQNGFMPTRQTELLIVCTMYNESEIELARTLKGVFKGIRYMHEKEEWGPEAWKKIVVCIVSDGRKVIDPRSLSLLSVLGCYQDGFAKNRIMGKDVEAHMYEYTTTFGINPLETVNVTKTVGTGKTDKNGQEIMKDEKQKVQKVKISKSNTVPIQMMFCLKEQNKKKVNSHRWCFEALCPVLNPNVVMLLDVGTEPEKKAIYRVWKAFKNPQVGGACGEIRTMLGREHAYSSNMGKLNARLKDWGSDAKVCLTNPLVAAQNFEYKISNILDKPMESAFGFVSVLPGAFSAYRWQALRNQYHDDPKTGLKVASGPLVSYFAAETTNPKEAGILKSNMYLAEDRILCFEVVSKRDCAWTLKYVKNAAAYTDVPDSLPEFINQRRRWLNGSFFAALYSMMYFFRVWSSSHSKSRKIFLHIELLYMAFNQLLSWFQISFYFLVFRILALNFATEFTGGEIVTYVLSIVYGMLVCATFILAFGNKPQNSKNFYKFVVSFFAIVMVYMLVATIYITAKTIINFEHEHLSASEIFKNKVFINLVISLGSTYVLYFVMSLLFLDCYHMFTCMAPYLLLSPSYINVLSIFAFCNMHDFSWGTKGDTGDKNDLGVAKQVGEEEIAVRIPTRPDEVDHFYLAGRELLQETRMASTKKRSEKEITDAKFANIRSGVVLVWMLCNFALISVVLGTGGLREVTNTETDDLTNANIFLGVVLWTVAFMALFRAIGAVVYLCTRGK